MLLKLLQVKGGIRQFVLLMIGVVVIGATGLGDIIVMLLEWIGDNFIAGFVSTLSCSLIYSTDTGEDCAADSLRVAAI